MNENQNGPSVVDLFPADAFVVGCGGDLSPERRKELVELARTLRVTADKIDAIVAVKPQKKADEHGEPTFRFEAKVKIPDDFRLTLRLTKYALDHGFDLPGMERMREDFVNYYNKSGKKWQDWGRVWMDWVRREKDSRANAPRERASSATLKRW